MIKLKNNADFLLYMTAAGALTAAADKAAVVVPCNGCICGVMASTGAKGTKPGDASANVVVDIHKNGTTIFKNAAKIVFDAGTIPAKSIDDLSTTPLAVSEGDVLSLDVDSIFDGTGPTQPKNLTVAVLIRRKTSPEAGTCKNSFMLG